MLLLFLVFLFLLTLLLLSLTVAGVVNIDVLAAVDIDPEVLTDADEPGLGSLLPGPAFGRTKPLRMFWVYYSLSHKRHLLN